MCSEILRFDPAVDIVQTSSGVRIVMPGSEFTLCDPSGLVRQICERFRAGDSRDGVLGAFSDERERNGASQLMDLLISRRALTAVKAPGRLTDPLRSWVGHYAATVADRSRSICLKGNGGLFERLSNRLEGLGFEVSGDEAGCSGAIAVCDRPDLSWLRQANRDAAGFSRPFFPVWLDRSAVRFGPVHLPGATGCLECLLHREQAVRGRQASVTDSSGDGMSVSPTMIDLACGLVVPEIVRWLDDAHVETDFGFAWRFDSLTMDMAIERVLRLPKCLVCSPMSGGIWHVAAQ